jgi:hypothetical protein
VHRTVDRAHVAAARSLERHGAQKGEDGDDGARPASTKCHVSSLYHHEPVRPIAGLPIGQGGGAAGRMAFLNGSGRCRRMPMPTI